MIHRTTVLFDYHGGTGRVVAEFKVGGSLINLRFGNGHEVAAVINTWDHATGQSRLDGMDLRTAVAGEVIDWIRVQAETEPDWYSGYLKWSGGTLRRPCERRKT